MKISLSGGEHLWLLPLDRRELHGALSRMGALLEQPDSSLDLLLLRDAGMAALNLARLGCCGPTNVLSFPSGVPGDWGSLALCVDAVRRESLLYGQDPAEHCLRLLAHGLAHLAGHDHGPAMDALCQRLLAAAMRF